MEPTASPNRTLGEPKGVVLARNDDRSASHRLRSERMARASRLALAMGGVVAVGAATALWLLHPSPVAIVVIIFGLVLLAIGLTQHLLLEIERSRWPDEALLWTDGVELLLHNGEVRAVAWNDPKLAFDLFHRPLPNDPSGEAFLEWKMGGYVPPCLLTESGFERLQSAAVAHGLGMAEFRHGRRGNEIRVFEVRAARSDGDISTPPVGRSFVEP